jgi:hypothetical protein
MTKTQKYTKDTDKMFCLRQVSPAKQEQNHVNANSVRKSGEDSNLEHIQNGTQSTMHKTEQHI